MQIFRRIELVFGRTFNKDIIYAGLSEQIIRGYAIDKVADEAVTAVLHADPDALTVVDLGIVGIGFFEVFLQRKHRLQFGNNKLCIRSVHAVLGGFAHERYVIIGVAVTGSDHAVLHTRVAQVHAGRQGDIQPVVSDDAVAYLDVPRRTARLTEVGRKRVNLDLVVNDDRDRLRQYGIYAADEGDVIVEHIRRRYDPVFAHVVTALFCQRYVKSLHIAFGKAVGHELAAQGNDGRTVHRRLIVGDHRRVFLLNGKGTSHAATQFVVAARLSRQFFIDGHRRGIRTGVADHSVVTNNKGQAIVSDQTAVLDLDLYFLFPSVIHQSGITVELYRYRLLDYVEFRSVARQRIVVRFRAALFEHRHRMISGIGYPSVFAVRNFHAQRYRAVFSFRRSVRLGIASAVLYRNELFTARSSAYRAPNHGESLGRQTERYGVFHRRTVIVGTVDRFAADVERSERHVQSLLSFAYFFHRVVEHRAKRIQMFVRALRQFGAEIGRLILAVIFCRKDIRLGRKISSEIGKVVIRFLDRQRSFHVRQYESVVSVRLFVSFQPDVFQHGLPNAGIRRIVSCNGTLYIADTLFQIPFVSVIKRLIQFHGKLFFAARIRHRRIAYRNAYRKRRNNDLTAYGGEVFEYVIGPAAANDARARDRHHASACVDVIGIRKVRYRFVRALDAPNGGRNGMRFRIVRHHGVLDRKAHYRRFDRDPTFVHVRFLIIHLIVVCDSFQLRLAEYSRRDRFQMRSLYFSKAVPVVDVHVVALEGETVDHYLHVRRVRTEQSQRRRFGQVAFARIRTGMIINSEINDPLGYTDRTVIAYARINKVIVLHAAAAHVTVRGTALDPDVIIAYVNNAVYPRCRSRVCVEVRFYAVLKIRRYRIPGKQSRRSGDRHAVFFSVVFHVHAADGKRRAALVDDHRSRNGGIVVQERIVIAVSYFFDHDVPRPRGNRQKRSVRYFLARDHRRRVHVDGDIDHLPFQVDILHDPGPALQRASAVHQRIPEIASAAHPERRCRRRVQFVIEYVPFRSGNDSVHRHRNFFRVDPEFPRHRVVQIARGTPDIVPLGVIYRFASRISVLHARDGNKISPRVSRRYLRSARSHSVRDRQVIVLAKQRVVRDNGLLIGSVIRRRRLGVIQSYLRLADTEVHFRASVDAIVSLPHKYRFRRGRARTVLDLRSADGHFPIADLFGLGRKRRRPAVLRIQKRRFHQNVIDRRRYDHALRVRRVDIRYDARCRRGDTQRYHLLFDRQYRRVRTIERVVARKITFGRRLPFHPYDIRPGMNGRIRPVHSVRTVQKLRRKGLTSDQVVVLFAQQMYLFVVRHRSVLDRHVDRSGRNGHNTVCSHVRSVRYSSARSQLHVNFVFVVTEIYPVSERHRSKVYSPVSRVDGRRIRSAVAHVRKRIRKGISVSYIGRHLPRFLRSVVNVPFRSGKDLFHRHRKGAF